MSELTGESEDVIPPSDLDVIALRALNGRVAVSIGATFGFVTLALAFSGLTLLSYQRSVEQHTYANASLVVLMSVITAIFWLLCLWRVGHWYEFVGGAVSCVGFGMREWTEPLDTLVWVEERSTRSETSTLIFHWSDRERRVLLSISDFRRHGYTGSLSTSERNANRLARGSAAGKGAEAGNGRVVSEEQLPDWSCAKCGAEIPSNFDVCWKCGTARQAAVSSK